MKLTGLILDKNRGTLPPGSWSFGKNFIISKDGQSILNEGGFDEYVSPPMTVMGNITIGNTNVIFSCNEVTSEIGTLVNGVYLPIVNDPIFNFNLQYPILGVGTYNHKNEIVVCFTDDFNPFRVLNLSNLPFSSGLTSSLGLVNTNEFALASLFPNIKNPSIRRITVNDNGGSLLSGVFYLAVAYVFDDMSSTTWQEVSNAIVVTDDSGSAGATSFNTYDGCPSGTPTGKAITVEFHNLDTNFSKLKVAVISKIGGVISAYETEVLYYALSSKSLVINNTSSLAVVSFKDIISPTAIYDKGRAITLVNNRLHLANLENNSIIPYQHYANAINVDWYRGDCVSLDSINSSYKDSAVIFDRKQFKSGEVYDLYIGLRNKEGGYYGTYHIPGRDVIGSNDDRNPLSGHPYDQICSNPRKFQFLNTSTDGYPTNGFDRGVSGKMGFWENANEVYPDDFVDLAGLKVRHHKFPDLATLENYKVGGKGFITEYPSVLGTASTIVMSTASIKYHPPWSGFVGPKFGIVFGTVTGTPYGEMYAQNTSYRANCVQSVNITLDANIQPGLSGGLITTVVVVIDIHNQEKVIYNGVTSWGVVLSDIYLKEGESVSIRSGADNIISLSTTEITTLTIVATKPNYIIEGTKFTQPLGIRVSNVVIPDELKEFVDGWEIFYAERGSGDMSVVAQDVLFGDHWYTGSFDLETNIRVHAFDLMTNRLAISPTHIVKQLGFDIGDEDYIPTQGGFTNYMNCTYNPATVLSAEVRTKPVTLKGYYPADINTSLYDNSRREDVLLLSCAADVTPLPDVRIRYLSDICSYKEDMYLNYQTKLLVSTGVFVNITNDAIQPSTVIYGGDTVISRYAYILNVIATPEPEGALNSHLTSYIISETISNANLRYQGLGKTEVYYPKCSRKVLVESQFNSDTVPITLSSGNYWGYDNTLNSVNNIVQPVIDYTNINLTNKFPYRIIRSLPKQTESASIQWRIFLSSDYFEMTSNKGPINKLTADTNRKLYIAHRYALFIAKIKDTIDTASGQLAIKEGDIFDREPEEIIATESGYIGNSSRFATFICKYGYFHVDKEKAKIYIISDSVKEISSQGVFDFLKDKFSVKVSISDGNLLYDDFSTLDYDDNANPLVYTRDWNRTIVDTDNPFTEVGISAGFDDDNDRILITANNRMYSNPGDGSEDPGGDLTKEGIPPQFIPHGISENEVSITNKSFTISYNCKFDYWEGFHDYLINCYIDTRTGLLGVVNHGDVITTTFLSTIYKLNSVDSYCKFPSIIKSTIIDFIFDNSETAESLIENIGFDCHIKSNDIVLWDKTLSSVMLTTRQQCTGQVNLLIQTWANQLTGGNVKNVKGIWLINAFKDLAMNTNSTFVDEEGEVISDNIANSEVSNIVLGGKYVVSNVESNSDYIVYDTVSYTGNGTLISPVLGVTTYTAYGLAKVRNFKEWFNMSNIYSKFALVRLKYDNTEQLLMKMNNVLINAK